MKRARLNFGLFALAVFWAVFLMSVVSKGQSWERVVTDRGIKIIDHFPLPDSHPDHNISVHSALSITDEPIVPLDETFKLHSRPGATKVIYLDFDGHEGFDGTYTPFNFEGNEDDFSDAELISIQLAWKLVSEDMIPFNVDVTTEFPGIEALRKSGGGDTHWGCRVVITHGPWDYSWAYIGSFNWEDDQEVYVNAGNGKWIWMGDTISHEVGHAFYLGHDGTTEGVEYYGGHGSGITHWSPIMGYTDYGLSQWSIGEYTNANNKEDDLEIITTRNGFDYIEDDHGSTTGSATYLNVGSLIEDDGIIERTDDVDYFEFTMANSGQVKFKINPDPLAPNLDILAKIHDAGGAVIHTSNPPDSLTASFNIVLPAGTYYLSVDGTGYDDPNSDGYSDYASLGYFSISGQVIYSGTEQYLLTVNNGSGDGIYYEGQIVSIKADQAPIGQKFDNWISSDGIIFADAGSSETTISMPSFNAEVTALYKDITSTGEVVNLVMPSNGGRLESFTSEYGSGWVASDLTNGITSEDGWSSVVDPGRQEFVYSFLNGLTATLNEAVIYSGTAEGTYFSKDFEVWISSDGNSFTMAASGTLQNTANTSLTLNLGETVAKKVKLVITSGYRTDYWELGEFEVYGVFGVTPVEDFENLPVVSSLAQNYPNPFNPSTTINYYIASRTHVTIKVYDILGNLVATLIDDVKTPGSYETQFTASNFPSGLYLLTMKAENYTGSLKMMLVK
jgi:hypothetical protein